MTPVVARTDPDDERPRRHWPRRLAVSAAFVVCVLGSMIGVGVFGGPPISQAADGLLAADGTHLAPGGGAFSIWSVIYVGLGLYTVWQWWDGDSRGVALPAIASMLLNATWILVVQAGWVFASVVVITALLAVLAVLFVRCRRRRPAGWIEAFVTDGVFGLYLGWVCVAICANIAAALAGAGFDGFGVPQWWAVAVLAVVAAVGVVLAHFGGGRLGVAAALTWGLAWIAVGRTAGEPSSTVVAVAAGTAAGLVALASVFARLRGTPHGGRTRTGQRPAVG
ncbi:tryptophan-rich sensory protein [Occultella gossypii]|uniref:Tryptophan-rich sensory protein n=1 Tax=Occultella gossypii TaxID=2800820 RepID=A0ABS7SDB9_9MICO|nr:tryptophan-rich sensory protein [Occultella gossypii]MBZ2198262.1 tryptophan-rich sensory protein [Occultella gossypii]